MENTMRLAATSLLFASVLGMAACAKEETGVKIEISCGKADPTCKDANQASRNMAGNSLDDSRAKLDFSKLEGVKSDKK
jgi:hypothetical protein